jgi:hypothetical protein
MDVKVARGSGFGDDVEDLGVGVLAAKGDDAGAVFLGQVVEYGFGLHTLFFLSVFREAYERRGCGTRPALLTVAARFVFRSGRRDEPRFVARFRFKLKFRTAEL